MTEYDQLSGTLRENKCLKDVLGVIVTYNPDVPRVIECILSAASQLESLLIIDNGSDGSILTKLKSNFRRGGLLTNEERVQIIENENNFGLAVAYNQASRIAEETGLKFLLLLDQDSLLTPGSVERLLDAFSNLSLSFNVGAVSALNVEKEPVSFDKFLWGYYIRKRMHRTRDIQESAFVFNSGTLIPLKVLEKLNGYDEKYFLDCVDQEMCLRLRRNSLRIFVIKKAIIQHREGEVIEKRLLFTKLKGKVQAPPRYYYLSRDSLRLFFEHFTALPTLSSIVILSLVLRLSRIILLQTGRRVCIRYFIKGMVDYFRGVSGRMPS